jgi:hypothetical protein
LLNIEAGLGGGEAKDFTAKDLGSLDDPFTHIEG